MRRRGVGRVVPEALTISPPPLSLPLENNSRGGREGWFRMMQDGRIRGGRNNQMIRRKGFGGGGAWEGRVSDGNL